VLTEKITASPCDEFMYR